MATERSSTKLTKRIVDAAEPREKRYELWDSELSGFGLRVETSGRKTYIVRYRANGGGRTAPRRLVVIGRHGTYSPDEARAEAKNVLAKATYAYHHGKLDPAAELKAKRQAETVSELIDLYESEGMRDMKDRTRRYTLARLHHHVLPLLGRKKVIEITAQDVERFICDVTDGKTAKDEKTGPRCRIIVKGGAGAAAKVVRDLSAILSFARRRGMIVQNPCDAVQKPADNARHRFLTPDEVQRLGDALTALEAEGVNSKAIAIARLWALTGCRRDEIAGLKWFEVDFERSCLILEDTKTGRSVRPLAAVTLAFLADQPRENDALYVFPAESGEGFYQGTKRFWPRIVAKANLPGVTPHTLRHTLGSMAVSSGETLAMTGALLGHATARATTIYAHMQMDPSRRAADRVTGAIAAALEGKPAAEVIPLERKRKTKSQHLAPPINS